MIMLFTEVEADDGEGGHGVVGVRAVGGDGDGDSLPRVPHPIIPRLAPAGEYWWTLQPLWAEIKGLPDKNQMKSTEISIAVG